MLIKTLRQKSVRLCFNAVSCFQLVLKKYTTSSLSLMSQQRQEGEFEQKITKTVETTKIQLLKDGFSALQWRMNFMRDCEIHCNN